MEPAGDAQNTHRYVVTHFCNTFQILLRPVTRASAAPLPILQQILQLAGAARGTSGTICRALEAGLRRQIQRQSLGRSKISVIPPRPGACARPKRFGGPPRVICAKSVPASCRRSAQTIDDPTAGWGAGHQVHVPHGLHCRLPATGCRVRCRWLAENGCLRRAAIASLSSAKVKSPRDAL